jgi:heme iron utilization protein
MNIDHARGTMPTEQTALDVLKELLVLQQLAAVATQMPAGPYASLVAFSVSDDLRKIAFVTSRTTAKFRNLSANPNVSLLIDSRTHSVEDFSTGTAVTAVGKATEITGSEAVATAKRFIGKHPYLEDFVQLPTTAIVQVCVEKYYIVTRFQHVVEHDVAQ